MLILVSGATNLPRGDELGDLIVPRSWNDPAALTLAPGRWAMDNGCFRGLDAGAFMRMLYAFRDRPGCLFVTVPDCVADAAETLQLWRFWCPIVRAAGHVPAFVAQNGLTEDRVPWEEFGALFIGGDDEFKDSHEVRSLCAYAKARGKWLHWGRVNGQRRYERATKAGADSIDGSGFSMHPSNMTARRAKWDRALAQQPELSEVP